MSELSKHFIAIAGHLDKIEEQLAGIERETNWLGFDGHLIKPDQIEAVNEINLAVHKARNKLNESSNPCPE